MQTQFNIDIAVHRGKVILTTDLLGLSDLSANTTREYSRYFAEAHALLSGPVAGGVVKPSPAPKPGPVQPPLPGL